MDESTKAEMIRNYNQAEVAKQKKSVEDQRKFAETQLQTARPRRIDAVVFDFESDEFDAAAAIPSQDVAPMYFSLTAGDTAKAPGAAFLALLQDSVATRGQKIIAKNVSWRGLEPRFLRLMVRNQVVRMDKTFLRATYLPLYFQANTFDWNSCVGAEKYGNSELLIKQLRLQEGLFDVSTLEELSQTLQLFAAFGLAPDVDLKRLIAQTPANQQLVTS